MDDCLDELIKGNINHWNQKQDDKSGLDFTQDYAKFKKPSQNKKIFVNVTSPWPLFYSKCKFRFFLQSLPNNFAVSIFKLVCLRKISYFTEQNRQSQFMSFS